MRKLSELSSEAQKIATDCVKAYLDAPTPVLAEALSLRTTTVRTMKGNITRAEEGKLFSLPK